MSDQPPFHIASTTFHHLLAARGLTVDRLRADTALRLFQTFADVRFESPVSPSSDGLRYAVARGEHAGHPAVALVLARRFGVRRPGGGTERHVEFRCTLWFADTPDLADLPEHEEWWFRGGAEERDMAGWFDSLSARPEWAVLRWRRPVAVDVSHVEL
ncbi:hypothetical protein LX15_005737 [Streptoalloteichus tenebrarius]|uniref:Uncharacterized protein n=1 Tax=Streptoalloteichus tenebrarius (strain ATCC 17920 / DSM 40477 / JCM 4838 / CBS 697.72 / NBRC 16177 / NCIMB 11028 / NRRL B-12390 / A12253. 1 / ISP 5477) TaxID=1933 RepID=A0ABT1I2K2_STRSD|nr:hypothetical protein [Streptoalloteichus tenebrarius]MCP2262006.1 hypothetical protein [Streptoalloteichus tenebrarius]BFF02127.1 hypothetical protein GCM10020241_38020 [Streptoalloteichus tenebrarius]